MADLKNDRAYGRVTFAREELFKKPDEAEDAERLEDLLATSEEMQRLWQKEVT